MKAKRQYFLISVPKLVPANEMRAYISDAVETWSGQFSTEDPLFGTLRNKVKVKSVRKPGEKK